MKCLRHDPGKVCSECGLDRRKLKVQALPPKSILDDELIIRKFTFDGSDGNRARKALERPTPDQLYGCTLKQQAPNGDCP